ncbi:hypothetical protein BZG01_11375 [Labilibaculum manganireducens]|uniref:DUF2971 domain-containing protein n=1 Tax=Labilibaculum manganireducens TaxID=1940525 RepID=A0A2N3I7X4_9BACT|nr:DUF2971 domain-containing protein [Labilibaculum manganireducens]PKQ66398.1 hypothetical protein BZG01_11375 [Labilibaculum manganireducens]
MIYQYTSIEKLRLILNSKKIRFTRLDKVDDKDESEPFKNRKIADKIFVSCWTEDADENLALWSMYGAIFKGVRIGLKRPIFKLKKVNYRTYRGLDIKNNLNKSVLIPPHEMITSKYFIVPSFYKDITFFKRMEYVNSDELEEKFNQYSDFKINENEATISLDFQEVAKYKKKEWKQQLESRYILGIIPFQKELDFEPNFNNMNHINHISSMLVSSLINGVELNFTYYDIDLDDDCLNNMEVMVGSKCTLEQYESIEQLLKEKCANYQILKSKLNFAE